MADRYLVAWLLNLNVLVRDETRGLDLEDQLAVDLVSLALIRRTLHDWVEFLRVDELIHFVATAVASVDSNLHAWLDIAGTSDDTSDLYKLADVLCPNISHLHHMLAAELSRYENGLIVALKLRWDASDRVGIGASVFTSNQTLLQFHLASQCEVKAALLHYHILTGEIIIAEVERWLWHR